MYLHSAVEFKILMTFDWAVRVVEIAVFLKQGSCLMVVLWKDKSESEMFLHLVVGLVDPFSKVLYFI